MHKRVSSEKSKMVDPSGKCNQKFTSSEKYKTKMKICFLLNPDPSKNYLCSFF